MAGADSIRPSIKKEGAPGNKVSGEQSHKTDVCEYGVGLRLYVGQLSRLHAAGRVSPGNWKEEVGMWPRK